MLCGVKGRHSSVFYDKYISNPFPIRTACWCHEQAVVLQRVGSRVPRKLSPTSPSLVQQSKQNKTSKQNERRQNSFFDRWAGAGSVAVSVLFFFSVPLMAAGGAGMGPGCNKGERAVISHGQQLPTVLYSTWDYRYELYVLLVSVAAICIASTNCSYY